MALIADYVDEVLDRGNKSEINKLKLMFGLGDLQYHDDFASAIAYPTGEWQGIQLGSDYPVFFQMCDSIQGVRRIIGGVAGSNTVPKPISHDTGVGLNKALANYASWFKNEYLPDLCKRSGYQEWNDTLSVACFDSYNKTSPVFTDLSVDNGANRQWYWMLCNEPFFYWQTGAPPHTPSLISRKITPAYFERQCSLFFPPQDNATFGAASGKTESMLNDLTDGWFVNTTRLLWVNGEFDPWRSASVSSSLRPGGPMTGTYEAPVFLIPGARHCNDMMTENGDSKAAWDVMQVQLSAVLKMADWVEEFYDGVPGGRSSARRDGQGKGVLG